MPRPQPPPSPTITPGAHEHDADGDTTAALSTKPANTKQKKQQQHTAGGLFFALGIAWAWPSQDPIHQQLTPTHPAYTSNRMDSSSPGASGSSGLPLHAKTTTPSPSSPQAEHMNTTPTMPTPPATLKPANAKQKKEQHTAGGLLFALGIAWVVSTEYVLLRAPAILPYLYVCQVLPLLAYRCVSYYQQHLQHYTLELCYFTNLLLIVFILAFPTSEVLFLICFGLLLGPVLTANVVYRCSFLMDDLQRFITWHMHTMPVIVVFALRWLPTDARFNVCQGGKNGSSDGSHCLYDRAPSLLLLLSLAATVGHTLIYNLYIWRLAPASTRAHLQYDNRWVSGDALLEMEEGEGFNSFFFGPPFPCTYYTDSHASLLHKHSYLYFVRRKIQGSRILTKTLNCFGPRFGARGRLLSFTLCTQLYNAIVISFAYACWVNRTFNVVYLSVIIFITAYYAGTYYSVLAGKAAAADAAAAATGSGCSPFKVMPLMEVPLKEMDGEPMPSGGGMMMSTMTAPAGGAAGDDEEEEEEGEEEKDMTLPPLLQGEEEDRLVGSGVMSSAIVAE